jgi:hypothetical protein
MSLAELTHPVIAALDHPLSASRKEGIFYFLFSSSPLYGLP